MIIIKSPEDLKKLKKACKISADVLKYAGQEITAGMSTYELDKLIHEATSHATWAKTVIPRNVRFPCQCMYLGK